MKVKMINSNLVFRTFHNNVTYKNILHPIESHVGKLLAPNQYGLTSVTLLDDTAANGSLTKYDVSELVGASLRVSMWRMSWTGCIVFIGNDEKVLNGSNVFYRELQGEDYKKRSLASADIIVPNDAVYMIVCASSHFVSLGDDITLDDVVLKDITEQLSKTQRQRALGDEGDTAFKTLNYLHSNKAKFTATEDCVVKVTCSTYINSIYTSISVVNGAGIDVTLPTGKTSHANEPPSGTRYIATLEYALKLKDGDVVYINYQDSDYELPSDQVMYGDDVLVGLRVEKVIHS